MMKVHWFFLCVLSGPRLCNYTCVRLMLITISMFGILLRIVRGPVIAPCLIATYSLFMLRGFILGNARADVENKVGFRVCTFGLLAVHCVRVCGPQPCDGRRSYIHGFRSPVRSRRMVRTIWAIGLLVTHCIQVRRILQCVGGGDQRGCIPPSYRLSRPKAG